MTGKPDRNSGRSMAPNPEIMSKIVFVANVYNTLGILYMEKLMSL